MIKPLYFFFFVIVCLLGLMACSAKPQDKFKNLTADEFDRLIQDEDVQRLDVRTVAEYSEGWTCVPLRNIAKDTYRAA